MNKAKVKIKILKIKINLKRKSNIYKYNIIDDIRWILVNIFFKNLIKIEQYKKKL